MFDDVNDMFHSLLQDLLDRGRVPVGTTSRDGNICAEIIGWRGVLDASQQKTLVTCPARALDLAYAAAEVLWYLDGKNDVTMIERYAPSYREKYAEPDGKSGAAYGPYIMQPLKYDYQSPLQQIVALLKAQPNSRQAVLSIWSRYHLGAALDGIERNVPCSLSWQFLARDGLLHVVHSLRSNDAWLGFPYDVFACNCFARLIAAELGLGIGTYTHFVGSVHLYERYRVKAEAILEERPHRRLLGTSGHGWRMNDTVNTAIVAVTLERQLRESGGAACKLHELYKCGDMAHDLFAACESKLRGSKYKPYMSERMPELC